MNPNDVALYAFTLGLAASLSPCGFPLLPAYLSLFVDQPARTSGVARARRALWAGGCVSAGFLVVFGALGGAVEAGARALMGWVPWVMVPLGAALAVAGALALAGRLRTPQLFVMRVQRGRGALAMVSFGAAYAVASLSCALPLFLAGVAGTFTRSGVAQGIVAIVAYVLGMSIVLASASLAVAFGGGAALRRVRRFTRAVPRAGGAVLLLVGAYLTYYWVSDLIDPVKSPRLVRMVEDVQGAVSNWVTASPRITGAVLGGIVLVALLWLAWRGHDPARHVVHAGGAGGGGKVGPAELGRREAGADEHAGADGVGARPPHVTTAVQARGMEAVQARGMEEVS